MAIGFIGINLVNYLLKYLKQICKQKWRPRQKYQIAVISFLMLSLYAHICGLITSSFGKHKIFDYYHVYQWFMILFMITDTHLLEDRFHGETSHVFVLITLIMIGFVFTSTFVASLINIEYRLTYNLTPSAGKKTEKGRKLMGWMS